MIYIQTLRRIYFSPELQERIRQERAQKGHTQHERTEQEPTDKAFISSLHNLVQCIKLDKGTVALPEMNQLGLMVGRGEIASIHCKEDGGDSTNG